MNIHVFGAVNSLFCVNYELQRSALDQQGIFSEDTANAGRRKFYMNDFLASKQSSGKTSGVAKYLMGILATGGFRVTKWMSNRREVLTAILLCKNGVRNY